MAEQKIDAVKMTRSIRDKILSSNCATCRGLSAWLSTREQARLMDAKAATAR